MLSQTSTNNNKRQRSQLSRGPSEFNPNEEPVISASHQNTQASTSKRKSRSPLRTVARPDPFDTALVAFTSPKLPRSSTSTLPRSSFMDELSDPGQRLKSASSSSLPPSSRQSNPRASSLHVVTSTSQNKQQNKKEKGKERLSTRSSKEDSGSFSGPIAAAEFERMKKEIEELKNIVQDHKKTIKKQSKRIEELKSDLNAGKTARKEHEHQLQVLSSKASKHEELVSALEITFQCQICIDYLTKPFALSPCGHVLCVSCLQDWFRKAPLSVEDMDIDPEDAEEYLLSRQKTCPCCRAVITRRPAPVFLVKNAVEIIKKHKASTDSSTIQGSESPLVGDENPWEGLFPEEGGRNDDEDEEYLVRHYYLDDLYADSDSDGLESIMMDAESGSESEAEDIHNNDLEEIYPEEEEGSDVESLEDPLFVKPSWEPPLDIYGREELGDLDEEHAAMLRRGCTLWMIRTCHMEYTHTEGFVAYLYALNNEQHPYDTIYTWTAEERNKWKLHRLFLGWNLHMPFNEGLDEEGGKVFLTQTLELYKNQPWKFHLDERPRAPGKSDLHVLVRADDGQGYETTDTEYYEW